MAFGLPAPASAVETQTITNVVIPSSVDQRGIDATVFQPAGSSATNQVPVILHSHGWGGAKTGTINAEFQAYLDAGFGVVSFSQRGFGATGGTANVQDPNIEAEDTSSVITYIAGLDWVKHDLDALGNPIADDPVLGAIGGSYGGGYQTMTALDEIEENGGVTRLDALAPEISWYNLPESLAPQGVVRTAWNLVLFAAGAAVLPQYVQKAFAWGTASSQWPDGTILGIDDPTDTVPNLDAEFHKHSPIAFVERGVRINVPTIVRQGQSDNLFNLNQGIHIFRDALTPGARAQSYFVGFNGGHALPSALPPGTPTGAQFVSGGADACSPLAGGWTQLRINFFKKVFAGESTTGLLPKRYNMTDIGGTKCFSYDDFTTFKTVGVNEDIDPTGSNGMVMTAAAGPPVNLPIADGPITVSGIPKLSGDVYSVTVDSRVFFALSMGTNPADAKIIGNNMMPLRNAQPSLGEAFSIELPGITAEIPAGQQLYLTVSPVSDMSFGHGSHVPGGFVFTDLKLEFPTVQ
jgi:pimeloyl-ACP methyl ester carboxylesterase